MSASRGWKPCACRARRATSAAAAPGAPSLASATGCGTSRRRVRLEPYTRPEILSADLSSFLLDLAQWGASDPAKLAFLDPPPLPALNEARALLTELGAIDAQGRITEEGRRLRALPLPPRLARMVVDAASEGAGELAAQIAAVLTERGLGGDDVNLEHRLDQFRRDRSRRAEDARAMVKRWADHSPVERRAAAIIRPARCSRSLIPTASRKIAAAARADSCWPMAAAAMSMRRRRCRANRFWRWRN